MCSRYSLFTQGDEDEMHRIIEEINRRYGGEQALEKLRIGDIFPTDIAPVLTAQGLKLMRWAFKGKTADGKEVKPINARSETLTRVPMFRGHLQNRCLIPAASYYEWEKLESGKAKYSFCDGRGEILYIAAIFQSLGDDPLVGNGFTIITRTASANVARIHNRMPVILTGDMRRAWLRGDRLESCLKTRLGP